MTGCFRSSDTALRDIQQNGHQTHIHQLEINHFSFQVLTLLSVSDGRSLVRQHSSTLISASYLSSFKFWSPSSRSLKRKRGGSGGTSLSCCSILRVEMSKITPLLLLLLLLTALVWSRAEVELEEGEENSEGAEGEITAGNEEKCWEER